MLECDEFYGLGPDQVASLIASDTITVPNEEKVVIFNTRAFCSWYYLVKLVTTCSYNNSLFSAKLHDS